VILVDTSVWIDHLRKGDSALAAELDAGRVLMHPFVIGEVALGHLVQRDRILALMQDLPPAPVATHDETLAFIDRRRLAGRGIGYVDAHLLASVALTGTARLWSRDKRLAGIAITLGLSFQRGGGTAREREKT